MASGELQVTIVGDKATVRDALKPRVIATQVLVDLARHSADDRVRLDAALALLQQV